ncbi:MAG: hypothetical protein BWY73_01330 [candidate division TA06 bacterium ADurb.Bin417]|uniref:Translocation protein TolB n=1 Tax=candidate division TA06 bacterium ADurb.Bin417 TaxID=1852828 RepID=A0A1V5MB47_UNCT6|nr:MAG: hypothetical protein BWY73_01330 [candidate division TA06 bacterium ADurb.Bin417]
MAWARLPLASGEPMGEPVLLAEARSSMQKSAHLHPFLSPDGRSGFFNSDESGRLQAYLIRLPDPGSGSDG